MLAWSQSRLGVDTYRSYVSPVILATLVHVIMLALIAGQWFDFSEAQRPQPRHLQARMIDMSSLQPDQTAAQQAAEQARAQEQARQAEQQRQEQALAEQQRQQEQQKQEQQQQQQEQQRQEQQRQQQLQREAEQQREQELAAQREVESRIRAEQERQQQADAERQRREDAERQAAEEQRRQEERRQAEERQRQQAAEAKAREEAQQREAQAQAEAQARAAAQQAAQAAADAVIGDIGSYISAMLTRNWNIPATARSGMQATVEIQLRPNGEIADVRVVQSSGDLAFDRSAEQAVRRTERLPRVAEVDPILFERRLRRTQVIFRPEGLRW